MLSFALAAAAAVQNPAAPSTCQALKRQYEAASMELASNYAEGIADDSAPRANLRATRDSNILATAQMVLTLMQASRCALPIRAPDSTTFAVPAMKCRTDMMTARGSVLPESCKRENWQPMTP